jgi:serine protease Do
LSNAQEAKIVNKIPEKTYENKQILMSSFADLIEDLLPLAVNITTVQNSKTQNSAVIDNNLLGDFPRTPIFEELKKQIDKQLQDDEYKKKIVSIGSGFIISKDGYIATNYHVIEDALEITTSLHDGTKHKTVVVAYDRKSDLALLKITPAKELKFARFGDSSRVKVGDWLIAIGNPYGLGSSVSLGILSARGRDISNSQFDDYLQTDAAINKGNSGGPLFNSKGEVVGINTSIFSPSNGSSGIAFATPANNAFSILRQLKEQGEVERGWIGVSVQDVSQQIASSIKMITPKGAFVTDINKNGPADKAGIMPADVILQFDDQEVIEMKSLPKIVSRLTIGKNVKVTIFRHGKLETVNMIIEKAPRDEYAKTSEKKPNNKIAGKILGMSFSENKADSSGEKSENILTIVDIDTKSEAYSKGLKTGDNIISINQQIITSFVKLQNIIKNNQNKNITMLVKRGSNIFFVNFSQ